MRVEVRISTRAIATRMKQQRGASDVMFPIPAALIVSGHGEHANVMTIAWIGMMSSTPPTIGISMISSHYSVELINATGEFTVNLPSAKQVEVVDYCGLVSGKKRNKFKDTGLTPIAGAKIATPIIEECPYNMECVVTETFEFGDFTMFLGEIVETHVTATCIDAETGKIQVAQLDPLVYCAVIREYWALGAKLGNGFQAGRDLANRLKMS